MTYLNSRKKINEMSPMGFSTLKVDISQIKIKVQCNMFFHHALFAVMSYTLAIFYHIAKNLVIKTYYLVIAIWLFRNYYLIFTSLLRLLYCRRPSYYFLSHNCDFLTRNYGFLSRNNDFFLSRNYGLQYFWYSLLDPSRLS